MVALRGATDEGGLSKRFWNKFKNESIFAIYTPFFVCLASGGLDPDRFRDFIAQDVLFYRAFAQAYDEMAEDCADDDDRAGIRRLRKGASEKLKLHDHVARDEDSVGRCRLEALEYEHYLDCRGDLSGAFKAYGDVFTHCELPQDALTVIFLGLYVAKIESGKISDIEILVKDLENLPDTEWDDQSVALLRIALGLAHLEAKNYKTVAIKFLDIRSGMVTKNDWSDLTSPQDVATYAGLCALATFDREELK